MRIELTTPWGSELNICVVMAENKKSFIAYVDWKETFDALPDEKAGQLVKYLFAYVSDENPETDDVLIKAVFANIKHQLKRDLKKWELLSAQRAEIGRLGGIKSGEARQSKMKQTKQMVKSGSKTKQNEHDNVNVNDNVIVIDNGKDKKPKINKKFIPPSLDEVKLYFKENGYNEQTAIKAFNSYNVADWHDSKGKQVLNWKQKMINVWFTEENKIKVYEDPVNKTIRELKELRERDKKHGN